MKHIGELMPSFPDIDSSKNYDEEICKVCGATIEFSRREYKKVCKDCGTWIFQRLKEKRNNQRRINCFICMDKGIVEYPVQKDATLYNYVARCSCPKGIKWSGTILLLEECKYSPRPEFIKEKNRVKYDYNTFMEKV